MKIMRLNIPASLLISAIAITGCDDDAAHKKAELQSRIEANEKILAADIKRAEQEKNPSAALGIILASEKTVCRGDDPCTFYLSWAKASTAAMQYLHKAIDGGDTQTLENLYTQPMMFFGPHWEPARIDYAQRFLEHADRIPAATPTERALLHVAANVAQNGRYTVRDTSHAATYLARAWAAGDPLAADNAAKLYLSILDYRNAYLWSLRCIQSCTRSSTVSLDELQPRLSPEAVKQAQQAALDASIIELDLSGT